MENSDEFWMQLAIDLAKESKTPFGAVITDPEGQFVGGYNTTIHHGATAHAEMNVLKKISELDYNTAEDLTLYSTVEPCPMCMSAIIWTGIGRLVYGASIDDAKNYGHQLDIPAKKLASKAWYVIEIKSGVEIAACKALFTSR